MDDPNRDTKWFIEMYVQEGGRVPPSSIKRDEIACICSGRCTIQGKLLLRSRDRPDIITIEVLGSGKRYTGTDVRYVDYGEVR